MGKGKGKNTLDPEEAEKIKEEQKSKQLLDEEEDSITVSQNIQKSAIFINELKLVH